MVIVQGECLNGEKIMKTHIVIGRTVHKGKEVVYRMSLPYYVAAQEETLVESAKRKIRVMYHSEYPYAKSRLSYSLVCEEGETVKKIEANKNKKGIFGIVKATVAGLRGKKEEKKMTETYKAVYQYGYAIYGVGKTDEEAIEDAKLYADNDVDWWTDIDYSSRVDGKMILIDISKALFDTVKMCGGDVRMEKDEDDVYKLPEEIEEGN